MILDRNLDLHEKMKHDKNDDYVAEYKTFFLVCYLKNTIYLGIYNTHISKMYNNNSTQERKMTNGRIVLSNSYITYEML